MAMTTLRKRSRQACVSCNARRVKCNVSEELPCRNCVAADTPCKIRESRRGKHPRNRHSQPRLLSVEHQYYHHQQQQTEETSSVNSVNCLNDGSHDRSVLPPVAEDVAASQVLAGLAQSCGNDAPPSLSHFSVAPTPQPGNNGTPYSASVDKGHEHEESVFLGESSSIRYMNDDTGAFPSGSSPPRKLRFLHSVPNAVKAENLIPRWEADRRRTRIQSLQAEGVFSFPSSAATEALLKAYFQWFHPCFAIVDEPDIWSRYHEGVLSPLLLQALLFIGITHCDEDVLPRVGLGTRHMAKCVFFNRAKDIYDVDFEPDKTVTIQALFLMSFWRAGALLEKDTRHWLGTALSLAQTKALHRSSSDPNARPARLRRRLWWSVYVRERQCAAALGHPSRIRDEDCDVEGIREGDFEHAFNQTTSPRLIGEYVAYMIGMCQLARMLGRILHNGYLPSRRLTGAERAQMKDELVTWREGLPANMRLRSHDDVDGSASFHTNMLHLAWNNMLILLYRSGCVGKNEEALAIDGQVALNAAARNSRIIEELLLDGILEHAQIHVITNIFNTLCIHTFSLRTSRGTGRSIAEHRAKVCLMGLQELQKTWEVRNWILQLFFQYLDQPTAASLQPRGAGTSSGPEGVGSETRRNGTRLSTPPNTSSHPGMESMDDLLMSELPCSWLTQEANEFLFTQIENEFAVGEGGPFEGLAGDLFAPS